MNWSKQISEPLFKDVLWSRPENRRHAGKLLIAGGHQQEFNDVSIAYAAALAAGIGSARVLVPSKLQRLLGTIFPEAEYAAANDIGSFSRQALAGFLDLSDWSDGVLVAGDLGRNSEVSVLIEKFVKEYKGPLTTAGDSLDYLYGNAWILERPGTTVCGEVSQLQKLAQPNVLIKQTDDLIRILDSLSEFSLRTQLAMITAIEKQIVVAYKGRVSTTRTSKGIVLAEMAAYAAVWSLQQPGNQFEALTTAAYCYSGS